MTPLGDLPESRAVTQPEAGGRAVAGAVTAELVTSAHGLTGSVRDAWRRLALASSLPYSTPEWMLAFFDHHHVGAELRLVVVRDGGEVVGLGPFVCGRPADRLQAVGLLASGIGQRTGPVAAPGREQEVGTAIGGALAGHGADVLTLEGVDARATIGAAIGAAWRTPLGAARLITDRTEPGPAVTLRTDGDHDAWLAAQSKNFREHLRRYPKAVAKRGGVVRRSEPAELPAHLDALFRLHHERFAALGRQSGLDDVRRCAVGAAVEAMAAQDLVRLWVVEAGGEIVGAQLFFVAGARMSGYNGGTSRDWQRESLGLVLLGQAVRDAHELGLGTLDLGAGGQSYKQRFADTDEPIAWQTLVPRTPRGALIHARRAPVRAGALLRDRVRTLPAARQEQITRALRRAGALRRRG
jgi:CelD/BcsL family acetyltransferase involved in cellulose biosynthesis